MGYLVEDVNLLHIFGVVEVCFQVVSFVGAEIWSVERLISKRLMERSQLVLRDTAGIERISITNKS